MPYIDDAVPRKECQVTPRGSTGGLLASLVPTRSIAKQSESGLSPEFPEVGGGSGGVGTWTFATVSGRLCTEPGQRSRLAPRRHGSGESAAEPGERAAFGRAIAAGTLGVHLLPGCMVQVSSDAGPAQQFVLPRPRAIGLKQSFKALGYAWLDRGQAGQHVFIPDTAENRDYVVQLYQPSTWQPALLDFARLDRRRTCTLALRRR